MKSIEEITEEMGDFTVARWKEQAKRNYARVENRDLSRGEYINSFIRHAYDSVKQATNRREGAD